MMSGLAQNIFNLKGNFMGTSGVLTCDLYAQSYSYLYKIIVFTREVTKCTSFTLTWNLVGSKYIGKLWDHFHGKVFLLLF